MGGGSSTGLKVGAIALLVVLVVVVFFLRDLAELVGVSERHARAIGIVVVTIGLLALASAARREAMKRLDDARRSRPPE